MIIDISTVKLVFGFARIGAPDPDSLEVVDSTASAVLGFLNKAIEASAKAEAEKRKALIEEASVPPPPLPDAAIARLLASSLNGQV